MMNQRLKESKQTIREFLRDHYSDEKLAALLAHAKDGRLAYFSCCCLVGFPYADHAAQGYNGSVPAAHSGNPLRGLPPADQAYYHLGSPQPSEEDSSQSDEARRRRLIPIIKAEIRRRDRERQRAATVVDRAFSEAGASVS